jgi:hypothetical protein
MNKRSGIDESHASRQAAPAATRRPVLSSRDIGGIGKGYCLFMHAETKLCAAESEWFQENRSDDRFLVYQNLVLAFLKRSDSFAAQCNQDLAGYVRHLASFWESRLNGHKRAIQIEHLS